MTTDEPLRPVPPSEEAQADAAVAARVHEESLDDSVSLRHRVLNIRTIGSLLFGLLLLFLLFRVVFGENFDWSEVGSLIRGADPTFLLYAFLAYYATFPLRGLRWKYILSKTGTEVKLKDSTEILFLSWFVNCLVPAKLGDLYRAYLLRANYGASLSRTVGTVFVERIADIIVIAILALTAGYWSFRGRSRPEIDLIFIFGIIVAISLIIMLVVLRYGGRRLDRFMPARMGDYWSKFHEGSTGALGVRSLPVVITLTILIWLLEGARLYFVIQALALPEVGLGHQRIGLRRAGGRAADRHPADAGRLRVRRGGHHRRPRALWRHGGARRRRGARRPDGEHHHRHHPGRDPVRIQPEDSQSARHPSDARRRDLTIRALRRAPASLFREVPSSY